jgi:pilus assembly protein CpaE
MADTIMRTLVATNNDALGQEVRTLLEQSGLECPPGHVVPLEAAADRASRIAPDLMILLLPSDPMESLEIVREIAKTVPDVHLLLVGPATDPKRILQTLHEGGAEYLDQSAMDSELAEALVRFKARAAAQPGRTAGCVLAVLAPSGGSGSSTVAVNLSVALAQSQGPCGLVDLRLSAGDLAAMLDLNPAHTIADLCEHVSRLDQSMFSQFLLPHPSGVYLLAAPGGFADAERVTPKGVRQALVMARARFSHVVLDLGDVRAAEQIEALWQADTIVIVVRLDYLSIRAARRTVEHLLQLGIDAKRLRVVVNHYGQRKQLSVTQAEESLGLRVSHLLPFDPAAANGAINKGVPVVSYWPRAKLSRSLRDLAVRLSGGLRPAQRLGA